MCQGTAAVASSQESTKDHTEQDDPLLTRSDHSANTADLDSEREVWEFMTPQAWHDSVASEGSIFRPTYQATIDTIRKTAEEGGYDVILEVGCGTGDIIGLMNEQKPLRTSITNLKGLIDGSSSQEQMVTIPCIGVDINIDFIGFCKKQHPHESCDFVVADALLLEEWWIEQGNDKKYNKPLVVCVNNTLNIMPHELRGGVVDQMIAVAGDDGLCMVSYWNGKYSTSNILYYACA
jgi:SAM-dependent methyltransferase